MSAQPVIVCHRALENRQRRANDVNRSAGISTGAVVANGENGKRVNDHAMKGSKCVCMFTGEVMMASAPYLHVLQ